MKPFEEMTKSEKMKNNVMLQLWVRSNTTDQQIKTLKQVKKEIIKYLNKSNFDEAYAKSIVELVVDKKLNNWR